MRLALNVVIQNDGDLMDVLLLLNPAPRIVIVTLDRNVWCSSRCGSLYPKIVYPRRLRGSKKRSGHDGEDVLVGKRAPAPKPGTCAHVTEI